MHAKRQLRLRVLEALDERIKQFRRREELWPLRVPEEPLSLDDVVRRALAGEARAFDAGALRSRTLLSLRWEDGSRWEAWVAALPSGLKVYCDSSDEETRVLASGGRNEGDEADRVFLQLLAESRGSHFGIEMSGGAPVSVRTAITDRDFLIDLFVELFEGTEAEPSLRDQLPPADEHGAEGRDFRRDVERWLGRATSFQPS